MEKSLVANNGNHRITKNGKAPLGPGKPETHLGQLVSVIVELPDRDCQVFGNLFRGFLGLGPDLNDYAKKACKAVTLHEKTIFSNDFKVKAKIGPPGRGHAIFAWSTRTAKAFVSPYVQPALGFQPFFNIRTATVRTRGDVFSRLLY